MPKPDLLQKHAQHIADFQKFCLQSADPKLACEYEFDDMLYNNLAFGFLMGRGVPIDDAYMLAFVHDIEPEYPTGIK